MARKGHLLWRFDRADQFLKPFVLVKLPAQSVVLDAVKLEDVGVQRLSGCLEVVYKALWASKRPQRHAAAVHHVAVLSPTPAVSVCPTLKNGSKQVCITPKTP